MKCIPKKMYFASVLVMAVNIAVSSGCNIRMCLKWSVTHDRLTLICKVDQLHFQVKFFSSFFPTVQAYCIQPNPTPKCKLNNDLNGTIYQDIKTNETRFTIYEKIDFHVNGDWTCTHGTNVDNDTVHVTVLEISAESTTTRSIDEQYQGSFLMAPSLILTVVAMLAMICKFACNRWSNNIYTKCISTYKWITDRVYKQVLLLIFLWLIIVPVWYTITIYYVSAAVGMILVVFSTTSGLLAYHIIVSMYSDKRLRQQQSHPNEESEENEENIVL